MSNNHPRLNFANLPLVEAATRFTLANPVPLSFSVIYDVKEKLLPEYNTIVEPHKIEAPPGITQTIQAKPGEPLGAVYTGNKNGIVLGIQNQLVSARWMREVRPDGPQYPRYEALRAELSRALDALKACAGPQTVPQVIVANIFYVNYITISHKEPVLERYLSDSAHLPILKHAQSTQKLEASWNEKSSYDLRFSLEQATAEIGAENSVEGYKLTTVAGMRLGKDHQPFNILDILHDRLQHLFESLISEAAKKEWGFANE